MLETGERWLADMQQRFAAQDVVYLRLLASVDVPATIGRSQFDVEDVQGGLLRVETRDYIIPADQLVLNDTPITPTAGDRIREAGYTYEVSSPGPGIAVWQWDGQQRVRYRIHTKLVANPS